MLRDGVEGAKTRFISRKTEPQVDLYRSTGLSIIIFYPASIDYKEWDFEELG